ncbi:MAG TPA: GNAT family N-acetyltransferase [Kofleriaceae bacterium]|nr:GNAT family N-acetyltransferase [Kofleriaceae bacterium]
MAITIRGIDANEVDRFRTELIRTFGFDSDPDERGAERFCELVQLPRTYAAFDGDEMVGTAASFDFELTVPGGTVPMAGLTMVSVRTSHRRRGILRQIIAAHLADVHERGEPLSGLWASEASIYQRFGYGVAAEGELLRCDTNAVRVDPPAVSDRVELVSGGLREHGVPALYDRARATRPGMYSRTRAWWEHRHEYDPAHRRGGASARRLVLAWRGDQPTGWMVYRQRAKWDDGLPEGAVEIVELVAIDAIAEHSLWHYATSIDLFPHLTWWNAPVDSLLPWLTPHRRHLARRRMDTLWLRLTDVPVALARRAYAAEDRLVIAIRDADRTENYALETSGGNASCTRTDAAPELHLDRAALGSIYLGGVRAALLARAGRITGSAEAIARADRLFAWPIAPWCPEIF